MKIVDVEFIELRCPLAEPIPFSLGVMTHRQFALVRIHTDEGITGIGETSVNFPFWSMEERRATVEQGIKPLLVGEDPLQVERLWEKMHCALYRLGLQWGALGPIYQAISGADLALWDIVGKALQQPIYRLFGGTADVPIPMYATGLDTRDLAGAARQAKDAGFAAVKLRVGFGAERDLANVRAVRDAVGAGVGVLVDANQAWEWPQVLEMVERLEPLIAGPGLAPGWVEEPLRVDDEEGYARLRERTRLRLASGENHFGRRQFLRLLQQGVFDVVMPDVTRAGGLTECRKICAMCRQFGVAYSPHHYGSDVGFAATLHLMATTPGWEILLRDVAPVPLREGILKTPIRIEGGRAFVPQGPGLGVELNPEALERYRVDDRR